MGEKKNEGVGKENIPSNDVCSKVNDEKQSFI
jgi:hypothetical protein